MRYILVVLTLLALAGASSAQSPVQEQALFGKWSTTEKHPSGAVITTVVTLTEAHQFTGTATVNDKPFMDFSGTWSLDGSTMEWRYEHSSNPALKPGFVDTDTIVSVSPTELVALSKLSGKQHTSTRVR